MAATAVAMGTAVTIGKMLCKLAENNLEIVLNNKTDQMWLSHSHHIGHGKLNPDGIGLVAVPPWCLRKDRNDQIYFPQAQVMSGAYAPAGVLVWHILPSSFYLVAFPFMSGTGVFNENRGFFTITPEEPQPEKMWKDAEKYVVDHDEINRKCERGLRSFTVTGSMDNLNPTKFEINLDQL